METEATVEWKIPFEGNLTLAKFFSALKRNALATNILEQTNVTRI